MPNVKAIDAATWAGLPEIALTEGEDLATKGLSADTYRLIRSDVASAAVTPWVAVGAESASEVGSPSEASAGYTLNNVTYSGQPKYKSTTGPLSATGSKSIVFAGRIRPLDLTQTGMIIGINDSGTLSIGRVNLSNGFDYFVQMPFEVAGSISTATSALTQGEWFEWIYCFDSDTAGLQEERWWDNRYVSGAQGTWNTGNNSLVGNADKVLDLSGSTFATDAGFTFANRDNSGAGDGVSSGSNNNRPLRAEVSWAGIWVGSVNLSSTTLRDAVFDGTIGHPEEIDAAVGSSAIFFTPGTAAAANAGQHQGSANGGVFDLFTTNTAA